MSDAFINPGSGNDVNIWTQFKVPDESKIVGVTSITMVDTELAAGPTRLLNALTRLKFDTTTHADRAVFQLKNNLGYDVLATMVQVRGKPIIRTTGKNGSIYSDDLKRDDDIRNNGEVVKKIENNYIFDKTQVSTIADYWYKHAGEKIHIYKLTLIGSRPWFVPGDWYTFTLGAPGAPEYIDSTVEVYSCSVERQCGGIGSTSLVVREVMENWAKTTLYEARIATGGSTKRRNNQSNTIIVGAADFDGTCTYRCDGTADEVEINAAIAAINETYGGGEVILSPGTFNIAESIIIASTQNIIFSGSGSGTVITSSALGEFAANSKAYIYIPSEEDIYIRNILIDGNNVDMLTSISGLYSEANPGRCFVSSVEVKNILSSGSEIIAGILFNGIGNSSASGCKIHDLAATGAGSQVLGINDVEMVYSNIVYNLSGAQTAHGIGGCKRCHLNRVFNITGISFNNYYDSYADAGTSNPCADTSSGGFNSSS
ncbi:MAG: hypothetical protein ACOYB0_09655 [Polynucleobacter sp.]